VIKSADKILKEFATPDHVKQRELDVGGKKAMLLFSGELCSSQFIGYAIKSLKTAKAFEDLTELNAKYVTTAETKVLEKDMMEDAISALLMGNAILCVDGIDGWLDIDVKMWDKRGVAEPPTETVTRGPREGFTEDIKTSLSLLSRKLRTPKLAVKRLKIGRVSATNIAIAYVDGIADDKIVKLIEKKLNAVDIDFVGDSFYVMQFLEQKPLSVFKQVGFSEKPDVIAAKLAEGRVAVFVDGSPIVLTVPFLLVEDFQSPEDYYERSQVSVLWRIVRYIAVILGVMVPGVYVAIAIYHFEIIPLNFVVNMLISVQGLPFPPLVEMIVLLLIFEILREAATRIPRAVGMTMGIITALVLGEAAMISGLVSPPAVMLVALSSMALFTVPNQIGTLGLLRIGMVVLGGIAGLYGLVIGVVGIVAYLVALDTYNTPYTAPFAPLVYDDLKDAIGRAPLGELVTRPESIPHSNHRRQKSRGESKK